MSVGQGMEGPGLDVQAGAVRTCLLSCLLLVETLEPLGYAKYQGGAVRDGGWKSCLLDQTPWS